MSIVARTRLLLLTGSAAALRLPRAGVPQFVALGHHNLMGPRPAQWLTAASDSRSRPIHADAASLEGQIKATVETNKVVVYSKSWCPFCAKTKSLFDSMGVEYTAVELDQLDEGEAMQAALLGLTQQRTVPNVFVAGKHLGGNDDTQRAAKSGELAKMLGK